VATRALLAAASLGLCVAGAALVVRGSWVPVEAHLSQIALDREFERNLTDSGSMGIAPDNHEAAPADGVTKVAGAAPASRRSPPAGKPLARITVERLGVRDVVLAGPATHDALARGPTMVKRGNAVSPVTVLAAHRDTHFLFIRDLRKGDIVTMEYVTGETERYRVTYFETVRWNAFAYPLDPPRPLLALTTCYPFGGTEYGGPWRRVVWAERMD
jgi:sortase A